MRIVCPSHVAAAGLVLALPISTGARAQTPEKQKEVPTFGATTELVYVRFHVEKKGGYVEAVDKDQLRVTEDGRPQSIAVLETPSTTERTIPTQVTLALDVSSSVMDAQLLDESLVKEVLLASLSKQATVALCAFGGELRCLTPATRDVDELMRGFDEAILFSGETRHQGTRLYASVADICREGKPKPGEKVQRAMVIFSDGLDNRGGKVGEAIQAAAEGDVRVYAIKLSQAFRETAPDLRGGLFGGPPNRAMYDYKKFDLDKLAGESGGRTYEPGTLDHKALATILRNIATEITMENVLGYQPEGAPSGRKHRVKVELVDKSIGTIRDGERTIVR
jgi:VWFA-related protein